MKKKAIQKARELIKRFMTEVKLSIPIDQGELLEDEARQCAKIVSDEMIKECLELGDGRLEFWTQVKIILEK